MNIDFIDLAFELAGSSDAPDESQSQEIAQQATERSARRARHGSRHRHRRRHGRISPADRIRRLVNSMSSGIADSLGLGDVAGDGFATRTAMGIDPDVRALLDPYRRVDLWT